MLASSVLRMKEKKTQFRKEEEEEQKSIAPSRLQKRKREKVAAEKRYIHERRNCWRELGGRKRGTIFCGGRGGRCRRVEKYIRTYVLLKPASSWVLSYKRGRITRKTGQKWTASSKLEAGGWWGSLLLPRIGEKKKKREEEEGKPMRLGENEKEEKEKDFPFSGRTQRLAASLLLLFFSLQRVCNIRPCNKGFCRKLNSVWTNRWINAQLYKRVNIPHKIKFNAFLSCLASLDPIQWGVGRGVLRFSKCCVCVCVRIIQHWRTKACSSTHVRGGSRGEVVSRGVSANPYRGRQAIRCVLGSNSGLYTLNENKSCFVVVAVDCAVAIHLWL